MACVDLRVGNGELLLAGCLLVVRGVRGRFLVRVLEDA